MNGRASLADEEVKRLVFTQQCFMGILFITSEYDALKAPLDGGENSFPGCPDLPPEEGEG